MERLTDEEGFECAQQAGAPLYELLFVVLVQLARHTRLVGGRDVIMDSAPVLAWRPTAPHSW